MYGLSDADLQIQARAREFTDELIPFEVTAELNHGELPADQVAGHAKRARELGLHAANMPAELGGGGCSSLQQVLVQEQVGRVTNGLAWVVGTPPSWLPAVATRYQLERFVLPTIRGDAEECYAITEEGAGSDVDAIEATARRDGDEYVLNGEKWHVTSYNTASFAFFQGKLAGGAHDGEHAMFLVDLPSFGVSVVRTPAYSHTLSHHHPIVAFRDVRVPAAHLVGAEGDGMSFAYEWFRFERLMVAARCLGAADRLVTEMTAFAAARRVQGRPIAEIGAVAAMLADSLTELFAARSLTYETARAIDAGAGVKVQHAQCSMAKLYASEMAGRVADRAVQVFGGRGYMRENVAERFFREVRVERIWEGTSEVQRAIIADQMAKRGVRALV
jgi:alkylation response protein AidB-like acyl-CoA dehydrogenase